MVEATPILESATARFDPASRGRANALEPGSSARRPLGLADQTRLEQVVVTLNNAAKVQRELGHIWLTWLPEDVGSGDRHRDAGAVGIPIAGLPAIFELFKCQGDPLARPL